MRMDRRDRRTQRENDTARSARVARALAALALALVLIVSGTLWPMQGAFARTEEEAILGEKVSAEEITDSESPAMDSSAPDASALDSSASGSSTSAGDAVVSQEESGGSSSAGSEREDSVIEGESDSSESGRGASDTPAQDSGAAAGLEEVNLAQRDWITSVSVGKKTDDGITVPADNTFTDGDPVRATITFMIPAGALGGEGSVLTYQLPEGLAVSKKQSGQLKTQEEQEETEAAAKEMGEEKALSSQEKAVTEGESSAAEEEISAEGKSIAYADYTVTTDGKVTITFNGNYDASSELYGGLAVDGTVKNSGKSRTAQVTFPGLKSGNSITVLSSPAGKARAAAQRRAAADAGLVVSKTAETSADWRSVSYTVTAESKDGTEGKVSVTDQLSAPEQVSLAASEDTLSVKKVSAAGKESAVSEKKYELAYASVGSTKTLTVSGLPALKADEKYVLSYTVDFTLDAYTYSIPGDSTISLTELMEKLGRKDFDESQVKSVTFSDESLVKVEKSEEGKWTLRSLGPFHTNELLTITMKDGSRTLVAVTDAQEVDLTPHLTAFTAYKKNNGTWEPCSTFADGDSAKFVLKYHVDSGVVHQGDTLVYSLGDVILPDEAKNGEVKQGTNTVGTYSISKDGKIRIALNDSFNAAESFDGDLDFEGTVKNTTGKSGQTVKFGASGTITINRDPKATDLAITKTAEKSGSGDDISYVITVSSTKGSDEAIDLSDSFSGLGSFDVSELDKFSVTYNGGDKGPDGSSLGSLSPKKGWGTDWSLKLPQIPASGGSYQIRYTLKPKNVRTDADGRRQVGNSAMARDFSHSPSAWTNTTLQESQVSKSVSGDWTHRKLHWTITIRNTDPVHDLSQDSFKDILTVNGKDAGEAGLPAELTLVDKKGNKTKIKVGADGSFKLPAGSTGAVYTLTYETDFPDGKTTESFSVKNTISEEHGGTTYTSTSEQGGISGTQTVYGVSKQVERNSALSDGSGQDLLWRAEISLPEGSELSADKILFTDTLSTKMRDSSTIAENKHYTTAKQLAEMSVLPADASGEKSGQKLVLGTDYEIQDASGKTITDFTSTEPLTGFKVVFKDSALTKLKGMTRIVLRYHATASYDLSAGNWRYVNTAEIPGHSSSSEFDHEKKTEFDKMSSALGPEANDKDGVGRYSGNAEVPLSGGLIYYRVRMKLPSGQQTVTLKDTLPEGLSYVTGSASAAETNGDYWKTANGMSVSADPQKQSDGTTLLTLTVNNPTLNNTDDWLAVYYTVKIDDEEYWKGAEHTQKNYINTVEWNGHTTSTSTVVKKTLKPLDKSSEVSDGSNGLKNLQYRVVVNPAGVDLDPLSTTLRLSDTLSGGNADTTIVFDPSTIQVHLYKADSDDHLGELVSKERYSYQYDEQKHRLTLLLPDELACVVTYNYSVDAGINAVTISNSAELEGVDSSQTSDNQRLTESTSSAHVYQYNLNVYKVDSEDYTIRLKGVTFRLDEYKGSAWSQEKGNYADWKKVKDVTTDEQGHFLISRTGDGLKDNTLYRLTETSVGENTTYEPGNEPYYFIWKGTVNGNANPTDGDVWNQIHDTWLLSGVQAKTYFLRDSGSLYVPNENTAVTVNKVWLNHDQSELKDESRTATVRLYRQSATPDGYKVSLNIHTSDNSKKYTTDLYVAKNTELKVRIRNATSASCNGGQSVGNTWEPWDDSSNANVINLSVGTISKDMTANIVVDNPWEGLGEDHLQIQYTKPTSYVYGDKQYVNIDGSAVTDKSAADVTLNKENGWSATWSNLPKTDADGSALSYHVEEETIPGFTTSYSENNAAGIQHGVLTVTNTKKEEKNTTSYSLPSTGGPGTAGYVCSGLLLMAAGMLLGVLRARRKLR